MEEFAVIETVFQNEGVFVLGWPNKIQITAHLILHSPFIKQYEKHFRIEVENGSAMYEFTGYHNGVHNCRLLCADGPEGI